MKGFMGKTLEEIAAILLPDIPVMKAADILSECCREELIYLNEHGGTLYPKLEETLGELRKNFNLYIVSNCQDGYIDTFLDYHKLWKYFDDIECSGRTSKSKGENIKLIIQRNNLVKSVYIGDTQGDLNAADFAGIPFLYATYGFGKISRKEITVNSFADIPELIKQVI
jgi:phosphoglycolate phosphatase